MFVEQLARYQLGLCQLRVTNIPMALKKNSTRKEVHSITLLHPVVCVCLPPPSRFGRGGGGKQTGRVLGVGGWA